jgi:ADP-heptose:LPS heptosyltransferase
LQAFDPLVVHVIEKILGRRSGSQSLSFGQSLDGTRDILIVTARDLIDLLAVVPAARALRKRFPLSRIHVLASQACAEVLAPRPEIFEVLRWSEDEPVLSRAFLDRVRELRRHPFDLALAIDSGDGRLGRVTAALSGAKLRLGMHPDGADPTLNLVVRTAVASGYRPVQSLEFLSFLGIPRESLAPQWEIPRPDLEYAGRLLNLRRKGNEGWLLGVDPGRGLSGARPTPKKLAWLVERVVASRGAVPILLTEDVNEPGVAEFRACLKNRLLEVPSRGIRDILAFAKSCDLFLSGNTNLFHFAVGLGIPTLGLFRHGEEERWIPRGHRTCRTLAWKPGARVLESEFLDHVDATRGAGMGALPIRITLAADAVEVHNLPVGGKAPDAGDAAGVEDVATVIRAVGSGRGR